jgi:hypothetical protein
MGAQTFNTGIPTQPIGSIPRPLELIEAISAFRAGQIKEAELEPLYGAAVLDTIRKFEATGSPIISDGEQRKSHNFATYCVDGLPNFAPDGFKLQLIGCGQSCWRDAHPSKGERGRRVMRAGRQTHHKDLIVE